MMFSLAASSSLPSVGLLTAEIMTYLNKNIHISPRADLLSLCNGAVRAKQVLEAAHLDRGLYHLIRRSARCIIA